MIRLKTSYSYKKTLNSMHNARTFVAENRTIRNSRQQLTTNDGKA